MTKKRTVIYDIETMNSIAEVARDYQISLVNSIAGFKHGEMAVFSAGRRTGKSTYLQVAKSRYYNTNLCKEIIIPRPPEPKYKFSRAKWYEAERPGHASWNTFSNEYHEILNWCIENFGPHPKRPDAWSRWSMGVSTVKFRDEKDYVLFQLKWA
jgi:hypothetical protein